MPRGITLTEGIHPLSFVVSEEGAYLSRDEVVVAVGQTLVPGQVLGRLVNPALASALSAANTGNTGNGLLTLAAPAVSSSVRQGAYKVTFTDATHFIVEDPSGIELGEGVAGAAWTKGVLFTVAAGATAFAAGDGFLIQATVDKSAEVYVAHNPLATDGSQKAAVIAAYPASAPAGYVTRVTVISRVAQVRQVNLTFASGATAAQIDQVVRDLADRNIIMR